MAAVLVTLVQAKAHLRITTPPLDPDDVEIQDALDDAEAVVLDYLKGRADPLWDAETAPLPVRRAILLMLSNFYEHRGDDMKPDEVVWHAVERLLMRLRDPALA